MKLDTIDKLITEEDIHSYVKNLWKTEIFKKSHLEHGFVHDIVAPFSTMPCFFFRASDEKLEKAHFATWWRGIQIRDYDNPYIHDLYLLHEIYHAGDMVFAAGLSHDAFKRKMQDNELGASVCSEIEAYFRLPGLREETFPNRIFADRFLESSDMQMRWERNPERVVKELRMYRQNIMMSELPKDHADRTEFWIKQFVYQNESWASVWVHRYDDVEKAMVTMRKLVDLGQKEEALDQHIQWLLSDDVSNGTTVPFINEAQAFAGIYWANKAAYEQDHQSASITSSLKESFPSPKAG